ncbi:MAG TPA: imelysin family protein [Polyangiales bacterium]|nr:imelysin family protein [Polyangiales bacterium]
MLVPDARAIGAATTALETRLQQLSAAQVDAGLEAARQAWRSAALAWQRSFAFPHGPYVETRALLRAAYWPVRPDAVEQLLRGSEPIDPARVAQLGVNVKGLYAIESLLFENDASGTAWLLGPLRARAIALLQACAADVRSYAEHANAALGDGSKFARELAGTGQAGIDRLLNGLLETVETAVIRIERVLVMTSPTGRGGRAPYVPQGGPSGTSTRLLQTWLEVCERVYGPAAKPSLGSLVAAVAPAIHQHATSSFAAARAALESLGQPIESAVQSARPQLTAAQDSLRQLEVVLRSELASALGVTITFTSHDGD